MHISFRYLLYFEAIFFMLLGGIAMVHPLLFSQGIELFLGAILIAAGIMQLIRLGQTHKEPGFWALLFSALLNLALGGVLLFFPLVGMLTLTYLLIVYFIFDGASKIYYAFQLKPRANWSWVLISGFLSLILSGLILAGVPSNATWILGLLVGICLFFFGLSLLSIATRLPEKS